MPDTFSKGLTSLDRLYNRDSSFDEFKGIDDVYRRFGIDKNAEDIYAPLRNILGKERGRAMQSAAFAGGRNATPGISRSRLESGFGDQLSQLLSGQAQTSIGQKNLAAQLFQQILGGKDQYAMGKAGTLGQGYLGYDRLAFDKEQAEGNWLDILSAFLGPAAKVGGAALTGGATLPFSFGDFGKKAVEGLGGQVKGTLEKTAKDLLGKLGLR